MDRHPPTPCKDWEKKLAALHPDDLSPSEQKELQAHIASCPACEAVLADYHKMSKLIHDTFMPDQPPGIWKMFLSNVPEHPATKKSSFHLLISPRRLYHNLPEPDYTSFVGRQRELDWLYHHLSHDDYSSPMVISGTSGVGKSALALALAHSYRTQFETLPGEERFNAIVWISSQEERFLARKKPAFPGLTSPTLGDLCTTIAKTLAREDITRSIENQDLLMHQALSSQRTLLILDNMDSILDSRLNVFLKNLPANTRCLMTSRSSTTASQARTLMGLQFEEAKKMITQEAEMHHLRLNKTQQQLLFKYTEGLPLPIKLSIARLKEGESFEQVLHLLSEANGILSDYCVKQQIHLARLQNPKVWGLMPGCSLFDQNVRASREALGAIADLSPTDLDTGLTFLKQLALINQDEGNRFWLLPLIQKHVAAEFLVNDSGPLMIERWLNWLTDFIEKYGVNLEFQIENVHIVELEYPHLLNAIRWCRDHERWSTTIRLVEGANFYPYLAGLFHELQEILEAGIQASKALQNERYYGQFLRLLGRMYWAQEQYGKALDCLEQAEEMAFLYQDEIELGRSANIRFGILFEQNQFEEAEQIAQAMWKRAEHQQNLEIKILAFYRLAECASYKYHSDTALQWLDQSEQWCIELGWSRRLAWNLSLRGATLIQQEKYNEAEAFLTRSLEMATSWHEYNLIALTKYQLAQVYLSKEQFHRARQYAIEAYNVYERLGMPEKMEKAQKILHMLKRE